MMLALNAVKDNYWETFRINESDLDFLYNKLFELETPLSTIELIKILADETYSYRERKVGEYQT